MATVGTFPKGFTGGTKGKTKGKRAKGKRQKCFGRGPVGRFLGDWSGGAECDRGDFDIIGALRNWLAGCFRVEASGISGARSGCQVRSVPFFFWRSGRACEWIARLGRLPAAQAQPLRRVWRPDPLP